LQSGEEERALLCTPRNSLRARRRIRTNQSLVVVEEWQKPIENRQKPIENRQTERKITITR